MREIPLGILKHSLMFSSLHTFSRSFVNPNRILSYKGVKGVQGERAFITSKAEVGRKDTSLDIILIVSFAISLGISVSSGSIKLGELRVESSPSSKAL